MNENDETPKTNANTQPKVTTKNIILILIIVAVIVIIAIAVNGNNEDYDDYGTDTSTYSSSDYDTDEDYDTSSSSDDDTSSSSSTIDDSDWDYSALEDDTLNIDSYDYESQNCYNRLLDYLDLMGFSRNGLIHQLQYDGYTDQAINNALYVLEGNKYVSWNVEAVKKAQEYMETFSFSQQRLYEQLIHDGFTQEQANYGATYGYNNN